MNNTLKGMTMAGLAAVFWGSMGVADSICFRTVTLRLWI